MHIYLVQLLPAQYGLETAHQVTAYTAHYGSAEGQQNAAVHHALKYHEGTAVQAGRRVSQSLYQGIAHANRGPDHSHPEEQVGTQIQQLLTAQYLFQGRLPAGRRPAGRLSRGQQSPEFAELPGVGQHNQGEGQDRTPQVFVHQRPGLQQSCPPRSAGGYKECKVGKLHRRDPQQGPRRQSQQETRHTRTQRHGFYNSWLQATSTASNTRFRSL